MTEEIYTLENGDYFKKHPSWHMEDSSWKASQILKIIRRNNINAHSIVEVGCGAGEILNQLYRSMPKDTEFTGFDISIDAIRLAKDKENSRLKFKHQDFLKSNNHYDLLLMIDVFEHVDDYLGFLRLCKGKAEFNIFHIPLDISIQGILRNLLIANRKSVGHLHYFTKETAIATLVDAGFNIIDYFYTGSRVDLPLKAIQSKLAVLPRKLLFKINEDFAVKTIGGFSLLVLAK